MDRNDYRAGANGMYVGYPVRNGGGRYILFAILSLVGSFLSGWGSVASFRQYGINHEILEKYFRVFTVTAANLQLNRDFTLKAGLFLILGMTLVFVCGTLLVAAVYCLIKLAGASQKSGPWPGGDFRYQ